MQPTTTSAIDATARPAVPTIECLAGPDCGPPIRLTPGRHVVGRAPAACLRFDDASVELHHAVLDVAADGSMTVTQIAGRRPTISALEPTTGRAVLGDGDELTFGSTRLAVRWSTGDRDGAHHPPLASPVASSERVTSLVALAAAVAVAAIIFRVTLHPIGWPLPAAIAVAAAALGMTWSTMAVRVRRMPLGASESLDWCRRPGVSERAQQRRIHRDRHPSLADVLNRFEAGIVEPETAPLGSGGTVGLSVALGLGDLQRDPNPIESAPSGRDLADDATHPVETSVVLTDVAIPFAVRAGETTNVTGPRHHALALTRAIIVQLAMRHTPPSWDLTIETSRQADWEWTEWLAQARHGDGSSAVHQVGDARTHARVGASHDDAVHVLVVDDPHRSAHRRTGSGAACVITIVDDHTSAGDAATLAIGSTGRARWCHELGGEPFAVSGLGDERATGLARRLALGLGADRHSCDQLVGGSPSNQRGPAPNPAAASSVL